MASPVMADTKNTIEVTRRVSVVLADKDNRPNVIMADSGSEPPAKFELLKVGMWRTARHGDIMIMPDDLTAYIENFKAGHAVSGNGKLKLPINYGHESWGKAAGWFVPAIEGDTLWATEIEWTPKAAQALKDGEWKCISAEFCPAGRGGWVNPLDEDEYIENVLEGAALTNIPLFSQLEPVMASASFSGGDNKPNVFLINADASENKGVSMTLEEVLAKDNTELNDEERTLLVENKDSLSAEQRTKFGFEVTPVKAEGDDENKNDNDEGEEVPENKTPENVETPELATVAASIKAGTHVLVKADTLSRLEETDKQYRQEKAENIVKAHIARGAIKADQLEKWSTKLVNASSTERTELEELLTNLNSNEAVSADTIGSDKNAADVTGEASKAIDTEAKKVMAAAKEAGEIIDLGTAYSRVMKEKPELAEQYYKEING